jgi:hypothetical protein
MTQTTDSDQGILKLIVNLDKKLDVFQARTDEQLKSIDQRLATFESRVSAQDGRLWTFITGLVLALLGLLSKFAFFPN